MGYPTNFRGVRTLGRLNPILRRLARSLSPDNRLRIWLRAKWEHFLTLGKKPVLIRLHGEKTWVNPEWRSLDPHYEKMAARSFLAAVQSGDTVWDVGSHIGIYTLLAARRVGPKGQITAWEPAPSAYEHLCTHLKLNHLENLCRAIPEIISDGLQREMAFEIDDGNEASFSNRLGYSAPDKAAKKVIQVLSRSLDDWAAALDRHPDVIKMDIEGAEIFALRGGRRLFSGELGKQPKILLSVHPASIHQYGETTHALETLIRSYGYRAMSLTGAPGNLSAFGEVWLLPSV